MPFGIENLVANICLTVYFNFSVVANVSDEEMQEHYDNFFEDVFVECEDKYGEIEEMNVCDNLGDHLVGNVYIKVKTKFYKFGISKSYGCLILVSSRRRCRSCSK